MKNSISKLVRALMASLVLISAAFAPQAEAGNKQGGKQRQQPNYANRDIRANDVRSASINNVNRNVNINRNVNVNRDVNVNVHGNVAHYNNRGCCYNRGWDDDYHPIATAAAVAATVAVTSAIVGSIVNAPPPGCVPVNYGGMIYQQCGGTWYQPQGRQYVVINPPY
jgi:hypothetical protein